MEHHAVGRLTDTKLTTAPGDGASRRGKIDLRIDGYCIACEVSIHADDKEEKVIRYVKTLE